MRFQPASFRPRFGRLLTIVGAVAAVSGLIGYVATGDLAGLARWGWWLLLIVALAWALFWAPVVDVEQHEVRVRNPLSTWSVPWPAIQRIDTKFALTLYTPGKRIEAWAAPAGSRYTVFTIGPDDVKVTESAKVAGSIRPGDSLSSDSGVAAQVIRRHWEELRDDGLLDAGIAAGMRASRTWHRGTIAVLAGLALLCALSLVL